MLDTDLLKAEFCQRFNTSPDFVYFSPGRVNLIGEHIDYNGGFVMPVAISLGITAVVGKRNDNTINIFAKDFNETFSISCNADFDVNSKKSWIKYILATLQVLKDKAVPLFGADILIESDLPLGAGLSSSAALECLMAYIFNENYYDINRTQLALDTQHAERHYVGVNCGIMDQFAVANGKENKAILLNCASLDFEYINADFGKYQLLIINSNKPRALADSKYNERRKECDDAFNILSRLDIAENLCSVHEISLAYLEDDVLYQRAKHAITENKRVLYSVDALTLNNLEAFGNALIQSHESLSEDYEVSCHELDEIVHLTTHFPTCIGARMTGAGFGGCAIALVEKPDVEKFKTYLSFNYERHFNIQLDIYSCSIVDGIKRIE